MMNLFRYIGPLLKSKWEFSKPRNAKILVFDRFWHEYLYKYFKKSDIEVLHVRFEKFNFYVLLKCILNLRISTKEYYKNYIEIVNPKIILSFIDNSEKIWNISKITNVKTAFIQTGMRCHFYENDNFKKNFNLRKKLKIFKINYMFVFNKYYSQKYNSFIKGKPIIIGSFKNNFHKKSNFNKKKEICLISSYRHFKDEQKIYASEISWRYYNQNSQFFLNWLKDYSTKNKLKINIIGKNFDQNGEKEFEYYKKSLEGLNFKYFKAEKKRNSYSLIDRFKYVFCIDSTLGIENLSRNGRTGFIGNTPQVYPISTRKFGWNENLSLEGKFWTSQNSSRDFERVFNFVINGNRSEWKKIFQRYKYLMINDKKNKIFLSHIKKII